MPEVKPHRDLYLTSPLIHGQDVRQLQVAVNKRFQPHIQADGQYGPKSEHAVAVVAWRLGCLHRDGRVSVQNAILHPESRTKGQLERAKHRAEIAKQQGQGLAAIVKHAEKYVGVSENPPGSNMGNPNPAGWEAHWGISHAPWCGAFAGCMILEAGGHVTNRVVYCPWIVLDAKAGANGFEKWSSTRGGVGPGWLILYDWDGDGVSDHVGIVRGFTPTTVKTVEGNTSSGNSGSQSNGGMVANRERPLALILGYAKPRF